MVRTTEIDVEGMMCGGCEEAVRRAVAALSGVTDVEVSISSRLVRVRHGEDGPAAEAIASAIEDAGYRATIRL